MGVCNQSAQLLAIVDLVPRTKVFGSPHSTGFVASLPSFLPLVILSLYSVGHYARWLGMSSQSAHL